MLTNAEFDRVIDRRDLVRKAEVPTPSHSEARAAVEYAEDQEEIAEAERRRRRVQHEVDPYPEDVPEVVHADLDKVFRQAEGGVPAGYPPMRQVSAEEFRRGPITVGESAYSPAYDSTARLVPVPPAPPAAGMIGRPLITDGQSRPCAPEVC